MADEDLRALERAWRANPADADAARALVRGLARRGDSRGADLVLAELARGGDETARADLERLTPWSAERPGSSDWPGLPPGYLPGEGAAVHAERVPASLRPLAVTDGVLLARDERELVCLSLGDPGKQWRAPLEPGALVTPAGRHVVHTEREALLLRSVSDGDVVARAPIRAAPRFLAASGDRAVLGYGREPAPFRLVLVDTGSSFGRVLWEVENARARARALDLSATRLFVRGWTYPMAVAALDLDGREQRSIFHFFDDKHGVGFVRWDRHGVVYHVIDGSSGATEIFIEYDLATGEERWTHEVPYAGGGTGYGAYGSGATFDTSELGQDVLRETWAAWLQRAGSGRTLVVVDRTTGGARQIPAGRAEALAMARDAVYTAERRDRAVGIAAFDATTGAVRSRFEVRLGVPLEDRTLELIPLDGGLAIVAWPAKGGAVVIAMVRS